MPTTSQLAALEYVESGFLLRIDGFPASFVSEDLINLEGMTWNNLSSGSWAPITASLDISSVGVQDNLNLQQGYIEDDSHIFKIKDVDGNFARLMFRTVDPEALTVLTNINPGTVITANVVSSEGTSIRGKHIGTEYLDTDGGRHKFPSYLQFRPGMEHIGASGDQVVSPALASDYPIVKAHRRVYLYRIYRDHITYPSSHGATTWRPPNEAEPIWWGVLSGIGSTNMLDFEIRCYGRGSLLKATIGKDVPAQEAEIYPDVPLDPSELKYFLAFQRTFFDAGGDASTQLGRQCVIYGTSLFTGSLNYVDPFAANIVDPRINYLNQIDQILREYQDDATASTIIFPEDPNAFAPPLNWTDNDTAVGVNNAGEFEIRTKYVLNPTDDPDINLNAGRVTNHAEVWIGLHHKLWKIIGYNPYLQSRVPADSEFATTMEEASDIADYPAGYILMSVNTCSDSIRGGYAKNFSESITIGNNVINAMNDGDYDAVNNGGNWRKFKPLFKNGSIIISSNLSSQSPQRAVINNPSEYYWRGQLNYPPLGANGGSSDGYSIGTMAVNTAGSWMIYGDRLVKEVGSGDDLTQEIEELQIVNASWRASTANYFMETSIISPSLVIHKFRDPKLFGITHGKVLDEDWISGVGLEGSAGIKCRPILDVRDLGTAQKDPDRLDVVMQKLLSTTGQGARWQGFDGTGAGASFVAGFNDNGASAPTDADYAVFGCGIPTGTLQSAQQFKSVVDGLPEELQRCRVYNAGPLNLDEVWPGMLQSRGLAWSLHGGQYGIFDYTKIPSPEDCELTIADDDIVSSDPAFIPVQEFREAAPIDKITLNYNWDLKEEALTAQEIFQAQDHQKRSRMGESTLEINDRSICVAMKAAGTWRQRAKDIATFWGSQHDIVFLPVERIKGRQVEIGSPVLITNRRLINSLGARGEVLAYTSRVLGKKYVPPDIGAGTGDYYELKLMIYSENPFIRFTAPIARGVGWDSSTNRFYIHDDYLEIGNGRIDATYFEENTIFDLGGDATIAVYQGGKDNQFSLLENKRCTGVSVSAGSSYLVLSGAMTASYKRDMDHFLVFAASGSQDALWVRTLYQPTANASGTFNGSIMPRWIDI